VINFAHTHVIGLVMKGSTIFSKQV